MVSCVTIIKAQTSWGDKGTLYDGFKGGECTPDKLSFMIAAVIDKVLQVTSWTWDHLGPILLRMDVALLTSGLDFSSLVANLFIPFVCFTLLPLPPSSRILFMKTKMSSFHRNWSLSISFV